MEEFINVPRAETDIIDYDYFSNPALKNVKINPHIGKELNLMIAGKKPAALIDYKLLKFWKQYKDRFKFFINDGEIVVTLHGQEWRAKKIFQLRKYFNSLDDDVPKSELKDYHMKLGLLLGYPKDDIRNFVGKQV